MLVAFEGIDGSGKTTVSNRVAKALREAGLQIEHLREGGRYGSSVTQALRELGRDARHLDLTPRAELLLYAAREAQLAEEVTVPALERADVVIADRSLWTAEILARWGRGLPAQDVEPVIRAASRVMPDLFVVVDVDPHVARARRRVSKIVTPDTRPGSRKGLGGVGLQHRLRRGYHAVSRREEARCLVVDNTEAPLDAVVRFLVEVVLRARARGVAAVLPQARARAPRAQSPAAASDTAGALGAFLGWIDRVAAREPAVAAYFLAGLAGPGVDERRRRLADLAPEVVAAGLRGLGDPCSAALRRALMGRAADGVARSLVGAAGDGDDARALRYALAGVVPAAVAASLDGRDDAAAWALREGLYGRTPDAVVPSVKRLDSARAWQLRDRWLTDRGGARALAVTPIAAVGCSSVTGVGGQRAWRMRLDAEGAAPVAALGAVSGLVCARAWTWRRRYLEGAPKIVMRTLHLMADPRAWELRDAVAPSCKEALDSMVGLDGPRAWGLREACADLWPSTVVKSLGGLADTARGDAMVRRQLELHAGDVSLLKHAASIALGMHRASAEAQD
jgi:dTMP kinase